MIVNHVNYIIYYWTITEYYYILLTGSISSGTSTSGVQDEGILIWIVVVWYNKGIQYFIATV